VASALIKLEKYQTPTGEVPFDRWFNRLSEDVQARIDTRLDRVSLGNFGDTEPVGDGVRELRFFFGPGYRVYYGIVEKQLVLLLGGGDKRTQRKDIAKAKMLWSEFKKELEARRKNANKKSSK